MGQPFISVFPSQGEGQKENTQSNSHFVAVKKRIPTSHGNFRSLSEVKGISLLTPLNLVMYLRAIASAHFCTLANGDDYSLENLE